MAIPGLKNRIRVFQFMVSSNRGLLNLFCPYKTDSAWANRRSRFAMRSVARFCRNRIVTKPCFPNHGLTHGKLGFENQGSENRVLPNPGFTNSWFQAWQTTITQAVSFLAIAKNDERILFCMGKTESSNSPKRPAEPVSGFKIWQKFCFGVPANRYAFCPESKPQKNRSRGLICRQLSYRARCRLRKHTDRLPWL